MLESKQVAANRTEHPPRTSLLGLPLELRTMFYEFMFITVANGMPAEIRIQYTHELAEWLRPFDMRFCDVSKGAYHEALPIASALTPLLIHDRHFFGRWR